MARFTLAGVSADHVLEVLFKAIQAVFTVHASAGPGGSISPSGDVAVNAGESITFEITPDTGFELDKIMLDGNEVPPDAVPAPNPY